MLKPIALIDCNNFYVSCERLFQPDLRGKPVIVLSNNDGCVIARSNEPKDLGIEMGVSWHLNKKKYEKNNVRLCSSNYELYGDISRRMMSVLQEFSPRLEIYSIDEAFLGLEGFNDQLVAHVHNIRNTLLTWTGIPVSIGVAPTKTLAKVANRLAKKDKASNGVRILMLPHEQHAALEHLTLDDIWGIARRMTQRLKTLDIHSPQELRATDTKFIRKNFGVTLERIVYELNGFSCLELEQIVSDRKSLIASQSFGHPVKIMDEMRQSIATHASRATEKMRRQNLATAHLIVFIETNPFQNTRPQYRAAQSLRLPVATSDTSRIVSGALKALTIIWRKDYDYKKGGVILLDLTPTSTLQEGLFDRSDTPASQSRMKALDALNNKYGKGTIVLGAASLRNGWSLRREYLSPNYTTNWQELLRV